MLTDPLALAAELETVQQERQSEAAPIRERLQVVENLLAKNQEQLQRLLDLYLAGDFPREMLVERKRKLETVVAELTREQAALNSRLKAQTPTAQQMQALQAFAAKIGKGLDRAEQNFQARRNIIDMLDVHTSARDIAPSLPSARLRHPVPATSPLPSETSLET